MYGTQYIMEDVWNYLSSTMVKYLALVRYHNRQPREFSQLRASTQVAMRSHTNAVTFARSWNSWWNPPGTISISLSSEIATCAKCLTAETSTRDSFSPKSILKGTRMSPSEWYSLSMWVRMEAAMPSLGGIAAASWISGSFRPAWAQRLSPNARSKVLKKSVPGIFISGKNRDRKFNTFMPGLGGIISAF